MSHRSCSTISRRAVGDAKVFCTRHPGGPVDGDHPGRQCGSADARTAGRLSDPNDFVVGDELHRRHRAKEPVPGVHCVGSGLTCKMAMFSGGVIGCDTTPPAALPVSTVRTMSVRAQLPGPSAPAGPGLPPPAHPDYPGVVGATIGHRIDSTAPPAWPPTTASRASEAAGGAPAEFQVVLRNNYFRW